MAQIVLDGVTKVFGRDVIAVNDVSLEVGDGEFMVLVGPSGCGKSTLLRIVAGLEELTDGEVIIGDTVVTDMTPKDRDIAMVFQNYALYPHMTVAQNLGIGLKMRRTPKAERQAKVTEVAHILGLDALLERKPAQLSGGQRQRVAIGRAMVREPRAFLMDEPLSNLDAKLRVQMRAELARLRDKLRTTTIYVTHDQVEAMTLGDRVAVMKEGVVQQLDTPHALYWDPANLFVAAFIGSPSMNLIEARIDGRDGAVRLVGAAAASRAASCTPSTAGRSRWASARPTSPTPRWSATSRVPTIDVQVEVTEELGSEVNVLFTLDAPPVDTADTRAIAEDEGGDLQIPLMVDAGRVACTARVDARSRCKQGEMLRLAVDTSRLYFFDTESGEAIATPQGVAQPA